jgi:glutamate-1-semialdehyde 2,1-aminomutase
MARLSPEGPVYQAGTLSGNPLAMAAGLATVQALHEPGVYAQLEAKAAKLAEGLSTAAAKAPADVCLNRVGSMLTVFFQPGPVANWSQASQSDTARYARFFHAMLGRGVYLPPSQYEALFVSLAHTDEQIDETISAAEAAFAEALGE